MNLEDLGQQCLDETRRRNGWIGVDLDGTLAHYDEFRGDDYVGEPIEPMVERVKQWLDEGKDVRIFTARKPHPSIRKFSKEKLRQDSPDYQRQGSQHADASG